MNTRDFLVDSAQLDPALKPFILDVCCGTGSVILAFAARFSHSMAIGCDFSKGMLRKAKGKASGHQVNFIEADAALLPFSSNVFDCVVCSHALYELKHETRINALKEMRRVVKPGSGSVLILEHERPSHPFTAMLFAIRMALVGSSHAGTFLGKGLDPFKEIFSAVDVSHSPSGKSRLLRCTKNSGS